MRDKLFYTMFYSCTFWMIVYLSSMVQECSSEEANPTDELRYTVQEERTHVMIGNLYVDASLHNKYSVSDLQEVHFQFLTDTDIDVTVTSDTGVLRVGDRGVDRDVICSGQELCELSLDVIVKNHLRFLEILKVVLEVADINDNSPKFVGDSSSDHDPVLTHYMPESAAIDTSFTIQPASDPDSGKRGRLRYHLLDTADARTFELRSRSSTDGAMDLRMYLKRALDR